MSGPDTASQEPLSWRRDLWMLIAIAAPNVVSTIAQTLMSVVDMIAVGELPNASAAQAAVSASGMIFFCAFAFLLGIMVCVTTVVSQSLGANRHRDCSAYAWQGIWLSVAFGIGAVALWPVVPHLYALIGHEPEVQAMEVVYMRIRLLSLGWAGATVALAHYFNGIHRPGVTASTMVVATVANIVLTWGLVLGKWGLPAMGVAGAAWGTVIATAMRTVLLWLAMCFGRHARPFHAWETWRLDRDKMTRLVKVGMPAGFAFVLDVAAWSGLCVFIVGQFGTVALAATAIVFRYLEMSFMPAIGISIAVSTVVGRAIGEDRPELARRRTALGTVVNVVFMGLMASIFVLFGPFLIRLFNEEPEVIKLGAELLILAAIFQVFDALAVTYSNALRGAGDTRWPAVVGALEAWIIMIGGSIWIARAHPELGAKGPWIFATLFIIVVGLTMWLRWRGGKWEELDVIGRREQPPGLEIETLPPGSAQAELEAAADAGIESQDDAESTPSCPTS